MGFYKTGRGWICLFHRRQCALSCLAPPGRPVSVPERTGHEGFPVKFCSQQTACSKGTTLVESISYGMLIFKEKMGWLWLKWALECGASELCHQTEELVRLSSPKPRGISELRTADMGPAPCQTTCSITYKHDTPLRRPWQLSCR